MLARGSTAATCTAPVTTSTGGTRYADHEQREVLAAGRTAHRSGQPGCDLVGARVRADVTQVVDHQDRGHETARHGIDAASARLSRSPSGGRRCRRPRARRRSGTPRSRRGRGSRTGTGRRCRRPPATMHSAPSTSSSGPPDRHEVQAHQPGRAEADQGADGQVPLRQQPARGGPRRTQPVRRRLRRNDGRTGRWTGSLPPGAAARRRGMRAR